MEAGAEETQEQSSGPGEERSRRPESVDEGEERARGPESSDEGEERAYRPESSDEREEGARRPESSDEREEGSHDSDDSDQSEEDDEESSGSKLPGVKAIGWGFVLLILAGYFVWLCEQMGGGTSTGAAPMLGVLAASVVGIGAAVIAFAVSRNKGKER